jgi:Ca-activated chloride channel family protein
MAPWYSIQWFRPSQWTQFHIANPLALTLIPAIMLLFAVRYYIHRRSQQRLNITLEPMQSLLGQSSVSRTYHTMLNSLRYLMPISVFIGVALVLIALSRPQIIREQREEQSDGIDIMLAMDVSESMTESDLPPTRLATARRLAQTFVDGRKSDRIGLVIFAGEAFSLCPLTTDYTLVKQYLGDLNAQMIRTSGTAIGDALARCINRMRDGVESSADTTRQRSGPEKGERSKIIILLSDGDNTAGNLDPITAARLANAFNIRLYTVAVGRPVRSETNASTVDEGVLKTIATIGKGSFFRATDSRRLRAVFNQIDRLERAPVRIQVYEDIQDYYRIYLYWGICFLLVALFLKNTIFGNVLED